MPYEEIEDSRIYQELESLTDEIWDVVAQWDRFARDSVGLQLVRSSDSIGANYAEAGGRFYPKDVINFLFHSRGSLRETNWWIRRARSRKMVPHEKADEWLARLRDLARSLNSFVKSQRQRLQRDANTSYVLRESSHPFEEGADLNPLQPSSQPANPPTS